MPDEPRICDLRAALSRMGGDLGILRKLVEFFREDVPPMLSQLRSAVDAGDADGVLHAAHGLRGLVCNFDAQAAVLAAQRLEHKAADCNLAGAGGAVLELERELARLSETLASELATMK
ncbi:MAG TPA: Hpt domain-containing protein [Planctomycetaceae bacterium]|nr:Hpt domain-containing protein [Planctomycetaceae bacterium]